MDLHRSVTEFFHDAVTTALKSRNVEAAETTEFYLVNLLAEFTNAERVNEEPLALKMAQASQASAEERARTLKEVGDTSLYVSGFFADSLARKLVDVDYYMAMGGAAYSQLARISANRSPASADFFREVYDELGSKFPRFVDVLTEIRQQSNFSSGTNVVRLYEEWVRTGSEWIEKRLRSTGLLSVEAFSEEKPVH